MHIAKFGLISINGHVAKLEASHDFRGYVSTMVFLEATRRTNDEFIDADAGGSKKSRLMESRTTKKRCVA